MNRRTSLLLLAVFAVMGLLYAQSEWEGTTAMGRYGEFPNSGYYGASDSFPRNTLVKVENLETGTTVPVLIVDRLDDPGLFLLLSREAAEELGIRDDQVVRTKVSLADNRGRLDRVDGDRPFSPDPDVNPAAGNNLAFLDRYAGDEGTAAPAPVSPPPAPAEEAQEDEPTPRLEGALIVEDIAGAESEETRASEPEPVLAEEPLPAPETPIDEGPRVEELYAGAPDREEFSAPLKEPVLLAGSRDEGRADNLYGAAAPASDAEFAAADLPPVPEFTEREAAIAEQFPLPEPPYDSEDESFVAAVPMLLEEPLSEETAMTEAPPETEPVEAEKPRPAVAPEEEVAILLEPAEARPAPAAASGETTTAFNLDPASHYLQLGVYSSVGSARTTADRFSPVYPVVVLNQDNALYKVLVGPLSPDESGALLLNFRAQGYRDAFIRKGF